VTDAALYPCDCPRCRDWRGEARCPDCGARIPASWDLCWPCQLERARDAEVIQRFWTP
jgi:hypothetical protein